MKNSNKFWINRGKPFIGVAVIVGSGVLAVHLGMRIEHDDTGSQTLAAWVQAVGSIGAIAGAIWISNEQYRRDERKRQQEQDRASYILRAELAWLSQNIMTALNQFSAIPPQTVGRVEMAPIDNQEMADFLDRLSWCRQRVEHKGQLAMLGDLRAALVRANQLVRQRAGDGYISFDDANILSEQRKQGLAVYNAAQGINIPKQYSGDA